MEVEKQQVPNEAGAAAGWGYWACRFEPLPAPVACAWKPFAESAEACPNTNFLKGVQWSPDGSCCLTASDDSRLRVFDLPQDAHLQFQGPDTTADAAAADATAAAEVAAAGGTGTAAAAAAAADAGPVTWRPAVQVHTGETVYDFCWFSGMSASDRASCCFASSSRGQPIRLWDACTGLQRATYRGYDDADEVTAAYSIAFNPGGSHIVGGYCKCLRVFDVCRPGRDCSRVQTHKKKQEGSIPGIISCLCFNPQEPDLFAAGSYSRCIGLFDLRTHEQLLWLEGHAGGVTQVTFSPDGNFLYSGARKDEFIHCWDIRATAQVVCSMKRPTGTTNQRMGFSIEPCGRHLATGGCYGCVHVFDLQNGQEVASFQAAADTVNGVHFSPCLPLLATASGHRRYALLPEDGWDTDSAAAAAAAGSEAAKVAAADGSDCAAAAAQGTNAAADLSMGAFQAGSSCNSLWLWRMAADWLPAAVGTEAAERA